jgi:peptide-methionine (R)-S-oxide reductase
VATRSIWKRTALPAISGLGAVAVLSVWLADGGAKERSLQKEQGKRAMSDQSSPARPVSEIPISELPKTEVQWRKTLTRQQYRVPREKGTERAFTGKYWNSKKQGVYRCAGCGAPLFSSETKFHSGTGWPSFYQPIDEKRIGSEHDYGYFAHRIEVHCARCAGHLGHVFPDGPPPTGLRYCINSVSLKLDERQTPKHGKMAGPAVPK